MGKKRIYQCDDCHAHISGRDRYQAHLRNHRIMAVAQRKKMRPQTIARWERMGYTKDTPTQGELL